MNADDDGIPEEVQENNLAQSVVCTIGLEDQETSDAEPDEFPPESEMSLKDQVHALQGVMEINDPRTMSICCFEANLGVYCVL